MACPGGEILLPPRECHLATDGGLLRTFAHTSSRSFNLALSKLQTGVRCKQCSFLVGCAYVSLDAKQILLATKRLRRIVLESATFQTSSFTVLRSTDLRMAPSLLKVAAVL